MEHAGRRRAAALGRLLTQNHERKRRPGKNERTHGTRNEHSGQYHQSEPRRDFHNARAGRMYGTRNTAAANTTSQSREKTFTTLMKHVLDDSVRTEEIVRQNIFKMAREDDTCSVQSTDSLRGWQERATRNSLSQTKRLKFIMCPFGRRLLGIRPAAEISHTARNLCSS